MLGDGSNLDSFGPDVFGVDFSTLGIEIPEVNPYDPGSDTDSFDPKLHALPPQERAPSLPRIKLQPSSVIFLERLDNGLSEGAPSGVFRVRFTDEGERILKIFHGVEKKQLGRGFVREAIAYRNLLRGGACAARVVPHCYGWAKIHLAQWDFHDKRDWLARFRNDPRSPRALILEYIPNATQMTLRFVTPERADATMEALKVVHRARVLHGDTHPRNILLLPDERIVWVDFELAMSWPSHRKLSTYDLEEELAVNWSWMFQMLIPWKWYASVRWNEEVGRDEIDIDSLEQGLVKRDYKIISRDMKGTWPYTGNQVNTNIVDGVAEENIT